jgi:hypothetical protein
MWQSRTIKNVAKALPGVACRNIRARLMKTLFNSLSAKITDGNPFSALVKLVCSALANPVCSALAKIRVARQRARAARMVMIIQQDRIILLKGMSGKEAEGILRRVKKF